MGEVNWLVSVSAPGRCSRDSPDSDTVQLTWTLTCPPGVKSAVSGLTPSGLQVRCSLASAACAVAVAVTGSYPCLEPGLDPAAGDLLTTDDRTADMSISTSGDALAILRQVAAEGGNLLVIGRPGSGKTTLLKHLVSAASAPGTRRYRFFFDLSLKGKDEPFPDFVTRTLAPYMPVEAAYVYPVLCYFARTGSLLCALDGLDEAVPAMTQAGFLDLFTQIAELLSAESATIMTSRVSFLEDSPHVRRLLDGTTLVAEKLIQQLHAHGVNPLHVPRFSVLRLHDAPDGGPLRRQLARQAAASPPGGAAAPAGTPDRGTSLDALLQEQITRLAPPHLLPQIVTFFGSAFLRGTTIFPLVDLVNELGIGIFDGGQVTLPSFRLRELFRSARSDGTAVAFRHAVLQELLAAEFLTTPAGRAAALAAAAEPKLTEQVRDFLHRRSHSAGSPDAGAGSCLVPAGVYLVGPGQHLMLRQIRAPFRLDQFPVTVHRYQQFLDAITRHGSTQWDHPAQPSGHTHQPWRERLRVPGYYDNPAYQNHPAIGVSWWSAYAFARYEGKRLPTSLEWEAAARGTDGRLFPWGDETDPSRVNCADSWSDHPLITYETWRDAFDHGQLADALPLPVDTHSGNVSPFGVREMAGNTWEWTATILQGLNEAVICGGSFDNPYRAIQASAKGTYRRRGASNAVGFRCAQDIGP
jgi:formylglycine-generating enzyme required for sulfatase activity/energy-coupling factor transporter ATP-binding protein EcfA2